MGNLNAYVIKNDDTDKKEISIFTKNGTQADKWRQAFLKIESATVDYDFKIAFDGVAGNTLKGKLTTL